MGIHLFSRKLEKLWCSEMLSVLRPSSEVVKGGRISENQTLTRPFVGVSLGVDSWAHSKSRSYNLKNCNFVLVPVWCQDLEVNGLF
jgi:hypothetical protein